MDMQEKVLIEFTTKQLRNVTFYYTIGVIATGYATYKVTLWGLNKIYDKLVQERKLREKEEA